VAADARRPHWSARGDSPATAQPQPWSR